MTVLPDDLATFLNAESIDQTRAYLMIDLATKLCAAIVSPVTDEADPVILSAAARAYANPTSTTAQLAGPYQVSGGTGGVYLNKAERAALRRLSGGGGAFSVDLLGIDGTGGATDYPDARFPTT